MGTPQPTARLHVNGIWSSVQVLDESRNGFGILARGLTDVAVGTLVQLRTASEWIEAEVAHVSACPETDTEDQPALRLGIRRVRELLVDADPPLPWYKSGRMPWHRTPYGLAWTLGASAVLFALLAGTLLVGFLPHPAVVFEGAQKPGGKTLHSRAIEGSTESTPRILRGATSTARLPSTSRNSTALVSDDNGAHSSPSTHNYHREWLQLLRQAKRHTALGHWNDSILATMAWVSERIVLTASQKAQVAKLLQQTNDTLERLPPPNANSDQTTAQRHSIIETAFAHLQSLLTDAQRLQWADLLRESGKH